MAVRSSIANLIARVRLLINDPSGVSQVFADQDIQDVLDASRVDVFNGPLRAEPTYTGATIQYLDYFASLGDWEDNVVLRQFLTTVVTPSVSENIVGHWQFAQTTLPSVFISGRTYDVYRVAADLLERQAAKWALSYGVNVDGQSLQRGQVLPALMSLARQYRMQQRPFALSATRTDLVEKDRFGTGAQEIDYMASGD